jgi:hypothetical protein
VRLEIEEERFELDRAHVPGFVRAYPCQHTTVAFLELQTDLADFDMNNFDVIGSGGAVILLRPVDIATNRRLFFKHIAYYQASMAAAPCHLAPVMARL